VVLNRVIRGIVKSYDRKTGKGLIVVDGEAVPVDLIGSRDVRLAVGVQVVFQKIHRPDGVFASDVRVIQQVLE